MVTPPVIELHGVSYLARHARKRWVLFVVHGDVIRPIMQLPITLSRPERTAALYDTICQFAVGNDPICHAIDEHFVPQM